MGPKKILEEAIFVLVILGIIALGYFQGLMPVEILGRHFIESFSSLVGFTAFIVLSGILFIKNLTRDESTENIEVPIAALIPTYRDENVMDNSVRSLARSNHDDLTIKIISEPGDDKTIEKAEELEEKYDSVEALLNESGVNTKAAAINHAVEDSDEDVFALFDADQTVDPDFISRASGYLEKHDIVQGRFIPETDGLVESLSYYEYALFGQAFRQIVYALTDFRMAASKSILFTRDAWEKAGGYNEKVVSEDYDFAHRCYRNDVDVKMIHSKAVKEESVHSFRDWWGQRKRWMTGNIQVLHNMIKMLPGNLTNHRIYISIILSIASIGGSLFLISLLPKFVIIIQRGDIWLAAAPALASYLAALPPRIMDYRNGRTDNIGFDFLLLPVTLPIFSLITIKASIEYFITWNGEWFSVEK